LTRKEQRVVVADKEFFQALFGKYDENLKLIEELLPVNINLREGEILVAGEEEAVNKAVNLLEDLYNYYLAGNPITTREIRYAFAADKSGVLGLLGDETVYITPRGKKIKPKSLGQKRYLEAIKKHDIVFAIGPAGTGKTYLAVVMAVLALKQKEVARIILTRPAVEAGEKLGFLPGDLQEKVNPYLRPLYDSLYDILGLETTQKYLEKQIIEVAPLAYMRGRTLDDAFIILDEAQNTTPEQMKMFLTRLGFGSKAVITGDITQVDLPRGQESGLVEAEQILKPIKGINFSYFSREDVVRHPLVQEIIEQYEKARKNKDREGTGHS